MKVDYYIVALPTNLFSQAARDEFWMDQAIHEARERTRIYASPCTWEARYLKTEGGHHVYQVKRYRA